MCAARTCDRAESRDNFESLIVNRICRPLHMDSTCITLTTEMKARLAMGHDDFRKPSRPGSFKPTLLGRHHSTANDLLKICIPRPSFTLHPDTADGKNAGDSRSTTLTVCRPGSRQACLAITALIGWIEALINRRGWNSRECRGAAVIMPWVGFDKKQRRGVVVLSTQTTYRLKRSLDIATDACRLPGESGTNSCARLSVSELHLPPIQTPDSCGSQRSFRNLRSPSGVSAGRFCPED